MYRRSTKGENAVASFIQKIDRAKPFFDAAHRTVMLFCKFLLVTDILITSMAVLGRYVSFIPDPAWSEEIVLTCMIYMAVVSASMALRRNAHIRMTALDIYLPVRVVQTLDVVADLAVSAFSVMMLVAGWKYCTGLGSKAFYTSMPTLSKFWLYFPIPLAGVCMLVFEAEILCRHIGAFFVKEVSKNES
ncbi:MAG: TRAP transporter small permease [Synergistaceae bacterium]|jgi:TRAP-type C4-dicarboxylate transport system permease small subunit|nr:TRAP transporter small permease [Synergistaceae bacterium]